MKAEELVGKTYAVLNIEDRDTGVNLTVKIVNEQTNNVRCIGNIAAREILVVEEDGLIDISLDYVLDKVKLGYFKEI